MMHSLYTRVLYEKRWFFAGWSVVFLVMTTLILTFYPSFSDAGGFDAVAASLPAQLRGFIGDPSVFRTLDGFIASQIYDIRMPLLIIIMSLVLAIGLTVRNEEKGDLRTILMTAMSRNRALTETFAAGITLIIGLNLIAVAGTYAGIASLGETAPHELIWRLFILSSLFGVASFSIPFGVGMATGKRATTLTIGLVVAIGSYLVTTFAKAVDWLKDWELLSLMHYYSTDSLRESSFERLDIIVLCLVIAAMYLGGLILFRDRDVT